MNDKNLYGFTEEEMNRAMAELKVGAWMGLIPAPDLEAVEERRKQKNKEIEIGMQDAVYGPTYYTPAMYIQYELTRFRLDYVVYTGDHVGHYPYKKITEEEKRSFYDKNRDLFTRSLDDSFEYEEVEMIIEKRLREEEYENIIQDLLR